MVWPFSSTPTESSPLPPTQSTNPIPSQSTPSNPPSLPSKPLTRDEQADQELNSFLRELSADAEPKPKPKVFARKPRPTSTAPTTSISTPSLNSDEPLSTALLPTTLSCRTAFDEAFYCNSFGGKFTDLYRHGNVRPCSESWSKFWFCMRTRTFSSPQKEDEIKEFYRKREEAKYGRDAEGKMMPSSEDVWQSRDKKVEWGTTFQNTEGGGADLGLGDEEWNERERERRRGVVGKGL